MMDLPEVCEVVAVEQGECRAAPASAMVAVTLTEADLAAAERVAEQRELDRAASVAEQEWERLAGLSLRDQAAWAAVDLHCRPPVGQAPEDQAEVVEEVDLVEQPVRISERHRVALVAQQVARAAADSVARRRMDSPMMQFPVAELRLVDTQPADFPDRDQAAQPAASPELVERQWAV